MAGNKGEVKKKGNESFRNGLKLLYVFFFLLLSLNIGILCNRALGMSLIPSLIILVAIALILNSVPLALLAIALFGVVFYLGPLCPP
ncbi:hypothetical protein H0N99_04970 [Candidatus Micrarchaeota archaeon]|nr:hypothetical protein [Candidatus Micrarchaeota archaeon]